MQDTEKSEAACCVKHLTATPSVSAQSGSSAAAPLPCQSRIYLLPEPPCLSDCCISDSLDCCGGHGRTSHWMSAPKTGRSCCTFTHNIFIGLTAVWKMCLSMTVYEQESILNLYVLWREERTLAVVAVLQMWTQFREPVVAVVHLCCFYRQMVSFGWLQLWESWVCSEFTVAAFLSVDIAANDSKLCKTNILARTRKKNVFLVLFVWFWKCRFSGRGRGENWKQTHPPWRASLSTKY